MVSFESDYIAGAHPEVLRRLCETNAEPLSGYGADAYTLRAKEKIRLACGLPEAQVEFLTGGTQTNAVIISTLLRDWEGVASAVSGHIATHEAGAIEYAGHKVLPLPQREGKLDARDLEDLLRAFRDDANREHMVAPGMVYLSHPTEYGTLYAKAELTAISEVCRRWDIPLYLDGARLGYGLMSPAADLTLPDIARLCDVFYIGGTKVGALCGEAAVFTRDNRPSHFLSSVKRRGALLAKGRLLGVQFDALFTDNLNFEISRHAIEMAEKLKAVLLRAGCELYLDSPTNQQFPVLDDARLARLEGKVGYSFWERLPDGRTVLRLATGWSTTQADLDALEAALGE